MTRPGRPRGRPPTPPRPRRRSAAKTILLFAAVILWVPTVMGLVFYYLWSQVPYRGYSGPRLMIEIPRDSGQEVIRLLQSRGVLRPGPFGRIYLALSGHGGDLKAGEYLFEGPLTASQVLRKLVRGDIFYHRITVPEGMRGPEVFAPFAREGFGQMAEYEAEFRNPSRIADLDPEATDLEGYLFPDTYALARGTPAAEVVSQMVEHHRQLWTPEWHARARALGLSVREVVTLASLIEKETGQGSERSRISSVFHNRLQRGMRLQCDPTIIFALAMRGRYRGRITRSDLQIDSRYNTYSYAGLPPGPIANPGREALFAALHPEASDYLYFVSMNNGFHAFSTNLGDHNRAVERFQR